ncbi:MAG: M20/M25/M40 family metallo-hydrolase [Solirubrobacteraceae bacterium]
MIDPDALAADVAAVVRVPSVTGEERAVLERLGELAAGHGLEAELQVHDLEALRAHPGHPGEEAPRGELCGLTVTLPGERPGRVCLNGHVDVVGVGSAPWRDGPWSGRIADGWLHGRGSVDMKGAVTAALHALLALRDAPEPAPTVVLQAVASEEDGGLGTFAALERDDAFDACLIPEPTGFDVVCAQAGALTFRATVRGRAAHAAMRLEGRSALDRYLSAHLALQAHERDLNRDVEHPAMRALALPYPLSVGRIEGGEWSSSVPDRVVVEGRLGVRVGSSAEDARAALEAVLDDGEAPPVEVAWTGGQFASGETDPAHPWVRAVAAAVRAERGSARTAGVPYGADMRLFCVRDIPTVMVGTGGLELAHAVDERVRVDELAALARIIAGAVPAF